MNIISFSMTYSNTSLPMISPRTCIYIYIYIYMCVCVFVCAYLYIHVCIFKYISVCITLHVWGRWCHNQVSRARISHCIPQNICFGMYFLIHVLDAGLWHQNIHIMYYISLIHIMNTFWWLLYCLEQYSVWLSWQCTFSIPICALSFSWNKRIISAIR